MHDPMYVAAEIVRPWPSRSRFHDAKDDGPRWAVRYRHNCLPSEQGSCGGCRGRTNSEMFPWWRASSYSRFSTLAGRGYFWPALITIWHHEPGGRDAGTVCKGYPKGWKLLRHIHHLSVQVSPFQSFRRWALTRCSWCGGRSRKGDPVNLSHSWDGLRGRWWQGEPGLFHHDCSSVESAHRQCICDDPLTQQRGYGNCMFCGKYRTWRPGDERIPEFEEATRLLAALPKGTRQSDELRERTKALWAAGRAREDSRRAVSGG